MKKIKQKLKRVVFRSKYDPYFGDNEILAMIIFFLEKQNQSLALASNAYNQLQFLKNVMKIFI